MRVREFEEETIRLMVESQHLPDIVGPGTFLQMMDWEARVKYFPEEDPGPWIWRPYFVARDRAREKHQRFHEFYLQDCDPSYNTNKNYNPPENIWDCTRTLDTIDGDWYEHHNCPKYKDQQRDHTTLPPLV